MASPGTCSPGAPGTGGSRWPRRSWAASGACLERSPGRTGRLRLDEILRAAVQPWLLRSVQVTVAKRPERRPSSRSSTRHWAFWLVGQHLSCGSSTTATLASPCCGPVRACTTLMPWNNHHTRAQAREAPQAWPSGQAGADLLRTAILAASFPRHLPEASQPEIRSSCCGAPSR